MTRLLCLIGMHSPGRWRLVHFERSGYFRGCNGCKEKWAADCTRCGAEITREEYW